MLILLDQMAEIEFKKFMTQADVEKEKRRKQEEWDRTRLPGDPLGMS